MALNNLTRIGNSGFGTDTSINTTGIVTAASFSGDGSALTGVTAVGSGVVVREEGSNVGTAQTINFIGTGVTATLSGGIANIEIATSGGGGGGGLSNVVEDTTPQLGGNLDLNSKNITGTGNINITGVATVGLTTVLETGILTHDLNVSGVSTFSSNVVITAPLSVQSTDGISLDSGANSTIKKVSNDIALKSTSGSVKLLNSSGGAAIDAGADQRLYSSGNLILNTISTGLQITGRVDPIADSTHDLGTNSVRWRNVYADTLYGNVTGTATTATNVTVANEASDTECFVMFGVNATGDNAPKSSSSLKYNSSSGGLTAGSFIGDGSGLTGITASGSGVIVRDGGSLVGTAGTIDFGANVSVSPISAGVVTVTASAGSIPGISTSGTTQLNNLTVAGVGTFTSGLTVPSTGAVTVGPNFTLSSNSNGSLVELRNSGGNSSDTLRYRAQTHQFMNSAATTTRMSVGNDGVSLNHDNIPVLKTVGAGVTIGTTGHSATLFTNQFSVSGISTLTGGLHIGSSSDASASMILGGSQGTQGINFTGVNSSDVNSTHYKNIRLNRVGGGFRYDLEFHSNGYSSGDIGDFIFYKRGTSFGRTERMRLHGQTGQLTVTGGGSFAGILTATTFSGSGASLTTLNASELDSGTIPDARFPSTLPAVSGANLTNLPSDTPADTDVQVTFDISSNGSSAYRFTGPGNSGSDDNPDLYLVRGQRYRFINGTGSSHPFEIRVSNGGSAYTDGITGSTSGTQDFNVQHDAPARLYYQCTVHSGMVGTIYIVGGDQFIPDGEKLSLGTDADLEIEHTGSGSFIRTSASSNGDLAIESRGTNHDLYLTAADDIYIRPQGGEDGIKVYGNGSVELFYDGAMRFQTNSDAVTMRGGGAHRCEGNFRPWSANTYDLGTSGDRWNKVYTNGVLFNGDTSADNTLDDYEEGTFTPTIYAGADNGSGGAPAFAIQAGRYVKIGRKVHCDIYIRFANGDLSTGVHARIGNLPFAIANESYGNVGASNLTRGGGVSTFHNTTNDTTTCYGTNNTGVFYLYKDGGTSFIFGGTNNASLNGLYWIGIFEYICTP